MIPEMLEMTPEMFEFVGCIVLGIGFLIAVFYTDWFFNKWHIHDKDNLKL